MTINLTRALSMALSRGMRAELQSPGVGSGPQDQQAGPGIPPTQGEFNWGLEVGAAWLRSSLGGAVCPRLQGTLQASTRPQSLPPPRRPLTHRQAESLLPPTHPLDCQFTGRLTCPSTERENASCSCKHQDTCDVISLCCDSCGLPLAFVHRAQTGLSREAGAENSVRRGISHLTWV